MTTSTVTARSKGYPEHYVEGIKGLCGFDVSSKTEPTYKLSDEEKTLGANAGPREVATITLKLGNKRSAQKSGRARGKAGTRTSAAITT